MRVIQLSTCLSLLENACYRLGRNQLKAEIMANMTKERLDPNECVELTARIDRLRSIIEKRYGGNREQKQKNQIQKK